MRSCTAIAGSTPDMPASCMSVTYYLHVVSCTFCDQQPGPMRFPSWLSFVAVQLACDKQVVHFQLLAFCTV